MNYYTKSELAKECKISESTVHDRLVDFEEFFSPVLVGNQLYYTKYDILKLLVIHGMRNTKPKHTTQEIRYRLKKFSDDFMNLELFKEYSKKLK